MQTLPAMQPIYAIIAFKSRPDLPETIECSFEGNNEKQIFELRIFDKRRARIERRVMRDFNADKSRYETQLPSTVRDIDGLKNVRQCILEFMNKAREITLSREYSNYRTDVYYI